MTKIVKIPAPLARTNINDKLLSIVQFKYRALPLPVESISMTLFIYDKIMFPKVFKFLEVFYIYCFSCHVLLLLHWLFKNLILILSWIIFRPLRLSMSIDWPFKSCMCSEIAKNICLIQNVIQLSRWEYCKWTRNTYLTTFYKWMWPA